MYRLLAAIIGLMAGYVAGAIAGFGLVEMFSQNAHDKDLERVMTAFFVDGPAGAVIGAIGGLFWRRE